MSELVFAIIILISAVVGFIGLGYMVFSPPTAPKIFLIAGVIGMIGFLGYAVLRVRAERQAQSSSNPSEQKH
jgi:quinol-cytochrome oxidoreductase complex cytochrome b subunit